MWPAALAALASDPKAEGVVSGIELSLPLLMTMIWEELARSAAAKVARVNRPRLPSSWSEIGAEPDP